MKMKIFILLFLASFIMATAQKNDSLSYEELTVNHFSINHSMSSMPSLFGNPDFIGEYENELDNEIWKDYNYKGNSFYFFNDILVSFNLRNNEYFFFNKSILVGNGIEEVRLFFPNSYSSKEVLNNLGFIIIDINMANGSISDTFVVINYDPTTNIISSIHLGSK